MGGLFFVFWFITFCCLVVVMFCLVCALDVFVCGVDFGFGLDVVFECVWLF